MVGRQEEVGGKNFDWLLIKSLEKRFNKKIRSANDLKGLPDTCSIQTANISKNLSNKLSK